MSKPILVYSRNSGHTPESAAGGTRHTQTAPNGPESTPPWLGATYGELAVWLAIAALVVGCLVLGAL